MKLPQRFIAALLSLVLLSVAGCAGTGGVALAKADVPRASADPAAATAAAAAINEFGAALYRRMAPGGGNVVLSPASIALALGMARAGAKGATASEMDAVLHELATDDHAAWLNALDAALATRSGTFKDEAGKDQPVTLRIANSVFSQQGMRLQDPYLAALASRYGAGVRLVDYKADVEAARKAINGWVSDETEKRIPELLAPGLLTPDVRLTLVNAVYLKAAWLSPFLEAQTKDGTFTRLDGSTVTVPFMATTASLRYAEGSGWQAVEVPYVGGSLALMIVLPAQLSTFEAGLSGARLADIAAALSVRGVTLGLPRFSIETKAQLAGILAALGMPTAFDAGRADFSGITTDEQLFISDVVHQANMDVDEKGTTAAAATAIVMRATAIPPPVTVRLERPFLIALRDVPTGTVLFLGRVTDPTAK